MTLATATLPVVRALIRKLRAKPEHGRVVGIHAEPVWHHTPMLTVDGTEVKVRACVSPLAVREALVEHRDEEAGTYLVVLTDCTADDLGTAIRAHFAGNRLVEVDLWETVQESFRGQVEPAFVARDKVWAPAALVEHEPAAGWPAAPGGRLTRDFALGQLAGAVLGVAADHVDAAALLRWSADPVAVRRYLELPDPVRVGLGGWLIERTGPAGELTLRAAAAGSAADATALALVADLLWHDEADPAGVGMARGMFAARLGGQPPSTQQAVTWGRVAKVLVSAELAEGVPSATAAVERAERLLATLGAQSVLPLSRFLPGSLDRRLRALAAALRATLPEFPSTALGSMEAALDAVQDHELAARDARVETATMAVRLTRWLAQSVVTGAPAGEPDTLAAALDRQARIDAWVDRAQADVFTGDQDRDVTAAYAALAAVAARRAGHDSQLATLLAEATSSDADLGRIIPVEEMLAAVVRPLAQGERGVLLVVIDGMSTGVATEIGDGLAARRWTELVDGALGGRQALLPALPTLTEVSRTSLLTGGLRVGHAAEEKRHFADAVGLAARLFHKDDLRAPAGAALAPEVTAAVADPAVRVVGVVLNTVDDTLHHVDPGGTTWTLESVQHLPALLDAARAADRVVVLTSDHGHVIERGSTLRSHRDTSSPRWRPATSPATDGEITVSGRRVLLGNGSVVLPWREDLRYAGKCAGYHGGASAAEVAVPIIVCIRGPVSSLAGWVPAPPPAPAWWHSPLAPERPRVVVAAPAADQPTPTLFDEPAPSRPETADPVAALLDALLASPVYADQRRRTGRSAPDDTRVRALLTTLLRNDGRLHEVTLAGTAQVPAARLRNVIAAVRKLLNVEGYDVLSVDADQVTVVLDVPLLREQFGLGGWP